MIIRMLTLDDLDPLVAHCRQHMAENGRDGDVIFGPQLGPNKKADTLHERIGRAMALDVGDPGWQRVWGAHDDDGQLMGHCDLRDRGVDNAYHRCLLGMGITRPYRRRGIGTQLLAAARDWAQSTGFSWIDLYVLTTNAPAQKLYTTFGFIEVGRVEDFFRAEGHRIGDIAMTLRL